VDATAESAAAAREKAIAQGQRDAFERLMDRLVAEGSRAAAPHPSDPALTQLVDDFVVAEERSSSVRYIAKLSFHFRPDAVRKVLLESAVPFAETRSKPVVVLPVWSGSAPPTLWDDPNPWRDAFAEQEHGEGLVPFILPLGDVDDLGAIGAEQALAGDQHALSAIAQRYGAEEVLLAEAAPEGDHIVVKLRRWRGGTQVSTDQVRADTLATAVSAVTGPIERAWKAQNLVGGGEQTITVAVPLTGLKDWVEIRRKLLAVPSVRRMALVYLTRGQAAVTLTYAGDERQLELALAQLDLALAPQADGAWVLQRRGAGG